MRIYRNIKYFLDDKTFGKNFLKIICAKRVISHNVTRRNMTCHCLI
jgi:hypothetical protein